MTIKKYPYKLTQKIDYLLFSNKIEQGLVDHINAINKEYYKLCDEQDKRPLGVHSPFGFWARVANFFKNKDKINQYNEDEISFVQKQINFKKSQLVSSQTPKPLKPKTRRTTIEDTLKKQPVEQAHVKELQKVWDTVSTRKQVVKAGTVIFSGQVSITHIAFDQMHMHDSYGQGMWLTEDIDVALSYAYGKYDVPPASKGAKGFYIEGRQLFAFIVKEDISVIEFDSDYHPGWLLKDAGYGDKQKAVSHVTLTVGFDTIKQNLVEKGVISESSAGHIRFEEGCTRISELWVKSPDNLTLELKSAYVLPIDSEKFRPIFHHGTSRKLGSQNAISILEDKFKSISLDKWIELSEMISIDQIKISLSEMLNTCEIEEISDHMRLILWSSTDPEVQRLIKDFEQEEQSINNSL